MSTQYICTGLPRGAFIRPGSRICLSCTLVAGLPRGGFIRPGMPPSLGGCCTPRGMCCCYLTPSWSIVVLRMATITTAVGYMACTRLGEPPYGGPNGWYTKSHHSNGYFSFRFVLSGLRSCYSCGLGCLHHVGMFQPYARRAMVFGNVRVPSAVYESGPTRLSWWSVDYWASNAHVRTHCFIGRYGICV